MSEKQPDSTVVKDTVASVYFWRFILQYALAVEKTKEKMVESSDILVGSEDASSSNDATREATLLDDSSSCWQVIR